MNPVQALLLSIVEGITEFLPISSTGHLILAIDLLGLPKSEFVKSFEIIVQLGAILAVVVFYWNTFTKNKKVWHKILTAFIPSAIIGFILYKLIRQYLLGNTGITLIALFLGGIIFILVEKYFKEKEHHLQHIERLSFSKALLIGLFQAISVIPGVSRAGATIIGGLFMGFDRKTAVEFSFLLAVPTMLAATALDLVKTGVHFTSSEISVLAIGFVGAFLTALATIKFFLQYIQKNTFTSFGIYRIILSVVFWILNT